MQAFAHPVTPSVGTMKPVSVTGLRRVTIRRAVAYPPVSASVPFDAESRHLDNWEPDSWRNREALQQPRYPDAEHLKNTVKEIEALPPLVFAGECRLLQHRLAAAANGEAFLLFGNFPYIASSCAAACFARSCTFERSATRVAASPHQEQLQLSYERQWRCAYRSTPRWSVRDRYF